MAPAYSLTPPSDRTSKPTIALSLSSFRRVPANRFAPSVQILSHRRDVRRGVLIPFQYNINSILFAHKKLSSINAPLKWKANKPSTRRVRARSSLRSKEGACLRTRTAGREMAVSRKGRRRSTVFFHEKSFPSGSKVPLV